MAFVHSKNSAFTLDAVDLSTFITNTTFEQNADSHDTTTYGKDAHVKFGGLLDGSITIEGIYEDGASGPRDTIQPLIGTNVAFIWHPEGAGAGLPEATGDCLVQSYVETSPVADMISWSCTIELSDDVTTSVQV